MGGGRAWPESHRRAWQHTARHASLVWRAPEGPEGQGGLRGAAPNELTPPSLAGGRGLRRPEHPWGHKQPIPKFRQRAYETGAGSTGDDHEKFETQTPLLAPEQQPLKPTTPLHPQNALMTPISHPQRR